MTPVHSGASPVPDVTIDERVATNWVVALRWRGLPVCPVCGHDKIYRFSDDRTFKCGKCRKRFSIKFGTAFQNSNLGMKVWLHAIWLVSCSENFPKIGLIASALNVNHRTATRVLEHIQRMSAAPSFVKAYELAQQNDWPSQFPIEFEARVKAALLMNPGELGAEAAGEREQCAMAERIPPGNKTRRARPNGVRDRIFSAARAEIATYGPTRARVDRIVKAANTSKERLYAHFSDKHALLQAVVQDRLQRREDATDFDVTNLPDFVSDLFDFYLAQPDAVRLARWLSLEEPVEEFDSLRTRAAQKRVAMIAQGQRAGLIDPSWEPATLLNMLAGLASTWAMAPEFMQKSVAPDPDGKLIQQRREQVKEAVRRLITPAR